MQVSILGAGGFLGSKLAASLALDPSIGGHRVERLVLADLAEPRPPAAAPFPVETLAGDILDPAVLARAIPPGTGLVVHLAAVVSSQAEAEFELGMRVNLDGTRAVLDRARALGVRPRFVFTSSVAALGGTLPNRIDDTTRLLPANSYGTQKAIGELLVADYTRKGFVSGVSLRLPTIVVRPGLPNRAASSFASGILREPLLGLPSILPVPESLALWVASPRRAVAWLRHAAALDPAAPGHDRTINPPGLTVTIAEMLAALAHHDPAARGRVTAQPDASIEAIVGSWPARFDHSRSLGLGFEAETDIASILATFLADDLAPTRALRGL